MKEMNMSKGCAMIFVLFIHLVLANGESGWQIVLAHQSFSINNIGGFMLPMFFILAGFSYAKTKKGIGYEIRQKIGSFFLYFVKYFLVIGILFAIIEIIKNKYTVEECLRALVSEFLTRSTCEWISPALYFKTSFHDIFVAIWYIWSYLFAVLFLILLVRIPARSLKQELGILAGAGVLAFGIYIFLPELPFELNAVPSMTFLMYAAQLAKKYKLYQKFIDLPHANKVLILTLAFFAGVICLSFGSVGWISHGTFINPYGIEGMESLPNWAVWPLVMLGSLLLSFWLIYMCRLLMKISFVGDFLAYFGVNSLDTMLLHAFFAMTICEITGLVCGRCLNAGDTLTSWMRIQCWLMFVLDVVLCYFWPKLKIEVIRKVKLGNE